MKSDWVAPLPPLTSTEYVPGVVGGNVATMFVAVIDVTVRGTKLPPNDPSEIIVCGVKFVPSIVIVGAGVLRPATVALEMESNFAA